MLRPREVTTKVILYLIKLDIILSIIHEYKTLLFNVTAKTLFIKKQHDFKINARRIYGIWLSHL